MATKTLTLGVIGTGTMGCGIAQVAAQCGYPVLFQNRKQDSVDKGLSKIEKALGGLAAKGKLSAAQVEAIRENIRGVVPLEELKGCDIVLESAPEDLELKRDLFQKLDGILAEDSILASNTSSLSITKLASFTRRPGHVVGMHFFNPVPMMRIALLQVRIRQIVGDFLFRPRAADCVRQRGLALGRFLRRTADVEHLAVQAGQEPLRLARGLGRVLGRGLE
jgi:3-hydroxybutyryl-CoA dehydrogenase